MEDPAEESVRNLAIIGTGLMGGSLGLACLERQIASTVTGFDIDPSKSQRALEKGAITAAASSGAEAVREAQVVVLATPVRAIPRVFEELAPHLQPGTIVTDVGSTKGKLVEQVSRVCPSGIHFIGGHPIAGSEQEGIDAAVAGLYNDCFWILTPTPQSDTGAYRTLMRLISQLGARVLSLDPVRHDEAMALSSHLPQLLSSALMNFVSASATPEERLPLLAAGGFLDMTRIAASSPELWVDIVRDNSAAVVKALEGFTTELQQVGKGLLDEDWGEVRSFLLQARQARKSLPGKPGVEPEEMIEIRIPVPDRAGVLADVATTVGEAGINIEDLDIVHSAEGGRGVIYLAITGRPHAIAAFQAIKQKGYHPEID